MIAGGTPKGAARSFYHEVVRAYEGKECLIWPYARDTNGYGLVGVDGKVRQVHRVLCHEVNGPPPTDGHQAAHSCGNGLGCCVTKGHLVWKTPAANEADKLLHGTHSRGEKSGKAKLTEAQAREIIRLKGKETQAAIAARFSVSVAAVANIHVGRTWSWLAALVAGSENEA